MLRAVLLDLDDTLYPEHTYFESGMSAIAALLSIHSGELESLWQARIAHELAQHGRDGILNRLAYRAAPGVAMEFSKMLLHAYRTHQPTISMFADAPGFLESCRGKGLLTGILTDGKSVVQWNKIGALQLEQFVDVVICTDDIGTEKPDPLPFRVAAARLRIDPTACCYVADDPRKDFMGAREVGMSTIRVCRPLERPLYKGGSVRVSGDADRIETGLEALLQQIPGEKT